MSASNPRRFDFAKKMGNLYPSVTKEIAGIEIEFRALKFRRIIQALKHISAMSDDLIKAGITFDNYSEPAKLASLASIAMEVSPKFIEEISDIHIDDLLELHLEDVILVLQAVIEVNSASFDNLVKNWNSLAENLPKDLLVQAQKN